MCCHQRNVINAQVVQHCGRRSCCGVTTCYLCSSSSTGITTGVLHPVEDQIMDAVVMPCLGPSLVITHYICDLQTLRTMSNVVVTHRDVGHFTDRANVCT